MKKRALICLVIGFVLLGTGVVCAQEDIEEFPECPYCGMNRKQFAHSRMLIEYGDESEGFCSLHCAAVDLAVKIDQTLQSVKVGDYNTKKLIDAERAVWVIGGDKMGVMTKRAKWAFEKKEDAEKFVKENKGNMATFEEAIKAAYEDMYADTKLIRDRRKMKKTGTMPVSPPKK
jgi:nitrous oxide reductase accessory protein NosL